MRSAVPAEDYAPRVGPTFWLALLLLVAATLQSTLAGRLHFSGGQPDFVLVVLIAAALLSDAAVGCRVGLVGGLLSAALAGEAVGTILVTRVMAGFVAGWFTRSMFRGNAGVALLATLTATIAAEVLFVLAAPRIGLWHWLQSAGVGLAWNLVLALPVTALLRRLGWGRPEE